MSSDEEPEDDENSEDDRSEEDSESFETSDADVESEEEEEDESTSSSSEGETNFHILSVKCYRGDQNIFFIPPISEILSHKCYHCIHTSNTSI